MAKNLKVVAVLCLFALPGTVRAADPKPRPLKPEDIHRIKSVKDPQVSPDGAWVAYTVTSHDTKEDRQDTDVWMVPRAGGEALRLTASPKGESRPRWSPDGRWLAFLSGREGDESQVWLLDRRGGEGVKITDFEGGVSDLAWSPDGKRLALIVTDPEPKGEEGEDDEAVVEEGDETVKPKPKQDEEEEEEGDKDRPKPIVIRRLQFKQDGDGYLNEQRSRLWIFDLESRKGFQVTSGPYDDGQPVWSPDGLTIAFASNRSENPDANDNSDIFLVEPKAGAKLRKLTSWAGNDSSPAFSPDGQWIVYVAGGDPKDVWYDTNTVAVVPVAGGEARELTPTLDRNVEEPLFTPDGQSVLFRVEDGGNVHLVRVPTGGGAMERIVEGDLEVEDHDLGPKGELVVLESRSTHPGEISAVDETGGRELRRLTRVNDEFLKGIRLGEVRRLKVKSADGTPIDAFLTLPPDSFPDRPAGKRLPTILRIHGGPVAQFSTGFQLDWQVFAGQGYAVVTANPRGSSGYGRAFSRALFGDWGNKDFQDVSAAVDHVISLGIADPDRLGVGGWSYGGILTNYVVVQTQRFKAAISGASETNYLANYGTDHYQKEWEGELGLPWENPELWIRLSPFFQAPKIKTPLLILCAGADVNVPCLNSEQMYQAVRRLGLETELVTYPDESHSLRRPSFIRDRFERSIAWYDQHLRPEMKKAVLEKKGKKK